MNAKQDKPLHIGVTSDPKTGDYVITAEYASGYEVLARFKTVKAAKAALPKVKKAYLNNQGV